MANSAPRGAQGTALRPDRAPPQLAESEVPSIECTVCLERIPVDARVCPECDEDVMPASTHRRTLPAPQPSEGWLRLHWRPLVTAIAVTGLLATGVTLRHMAPEAYSTPQLVAPPTIAADTSCPEACWHGESCQMGTCEWSTPNDSGHLRREIEVSGPISLPDSFTDALPLDEDRFAVSALGGVEIRDAREGQRLSLLSDAPHAQQLMRVGDVFYASSPRRVYVVDVDTAHVLKTLELGGVVGEMTLGASGQRALLSMPGRKSVAVVATDYHAEVSRFFFGDDKVHGVALDDTGERALTTNGYVPLGGLKPSSQADRYGAMYAFDASALPSEQGKVRTGLVGNPVDVMMAPDEARSSYVVLREKDTVVRLERMPNGSVRQNAHWQTCRQPEQIDLVRRGRRAIVRCGMGHAVEIFDLDAEKMVRHIPFEARVSDLVVSPDARQALAVLPRDGQAKGAVVAIDLETYDVTHHEVDGDPHRIRITPDGKTALLLSDSSKSAWVIR